MNEQWTREGFDHYYVAAKTEGEVFEEQVLLSHMIRGILPCEVRRIEEDEAYYFNLGSCGLYIDQIGKLDARGFIRELICIIEEAEDYLLNPDNFILTDRHVYVRDGRPALCYVPGCGSDITLQLKEFVQSCTEQLDYGNREQVTFFYELHNKLRKGFISLSELKGFVEPAKIKISDADVMEASPPGEREGTKCQVPEEQKEEKGKRMIWPVLLYIPLVFSTAYFAVRSWNEGMTYPNMRGILTGGILLAVNTGCLWAAVRKKNKKMQTVQTRDEGGAFPGDQTELLSDETVLLVSESVPVLKLSGQEGQEIPVQSREFTVGRQQGSVDFCLPQPGVSRRHFQILTDGGSYLIRDLGSRNGTFVNGERVWKESVLRNGDEIKAGTEQLKFMV
ncbi:DUF6382 domain-containing protein [Anaerostipes sp.]|uniref:DUF6382 domain-containing protein n=1 Tax=Anaerostipes sp. TaxID=1872530 RepID=UPI0025B9A998|nr:DUF6382 domain-containing protein [Anaerostipes sp.]MBS7008956.1 FHA domain-containing protein [Anaerostipes sp.]